MARDTFEVRFDRHGHMIIDDAELERRILYLLRNDGELVLRMRALPPAQRGEDLPNSWRCPEPQPIPLPRNGSLCPNMMCDCGALRIVQEQVFTRQWNDLGRVQPPIE